MSCLYVVLIKRRNSGKTYCVNMFISFKEFQRSKKYLNIIRIRLYIKIHNSTIPHSVTVEYIENGFHKLY